MKSAYMVSFRAKNAEPNQHPHVMEKNVIMCAESIADIAELAEDACGGAEIASLFVSDGDFTVYVGGITLNHELAL